MTTLPGNALAGIKVLDFSHVIAGPFATQILADLGAEVVKIEPPGDGDVGRRTAPFHQGASHYFLAFNRNKKSVVLDIRTDEGREVVMRAASEADVVVENFRPGVMDRLGLGYEALRAINPSLIYCGISGFGRTSPGRDRKIYDIITQAESGVMSVNGTPDGPPMRVGIPIADVAPALYAAIGVLGAVIQRQRTGEGALIDLSCVDATTALLANVGTLQTVSGVTPQRYGTRHYHTAPYGIFPTQDGSVAIAVITDPAWQGVCKAFDDEVAAGDLELRRVEGRARRRDEVNDWLEAHTSGRTTADVLDRLTAASVPCSAIASVEAALHSDHAIQRGMLARVEHADYGAVDIIGSPLIGLVDNGQHHAPPLLGEHTDELLARWTAQHDET